MGWELFCEVTWPHETPKRCQKLHSMCVFYKIDSEAKCAWACACCSVCLLHICSLLCACAPYCIGGMNCCSPVHTHTLTKGRQRKQLSHNCIGTILGPHTPVCSVHILTLVSNIALTHSSHVQLMSHSLNSWIFPLSLFT